MRRWSPPWALVLMLVLVLVLASTTTAHVSVVPTTLPVGVSTLVTWRVPHGCSGSPTRAVQLDVPSQATGVVAKVKPGWALTRTYRPLDPPVVEHGVPVTQTLDAVTWSVIDTADALPDGLLDEFQALVKPLATAPVGSTLVLAARQWCMSGAWSNWTGAPGGYGAPAAGSATPAPTVTLLSSRAPTADSTADGSAWTGTDTMATIALALTIVHILVALARHMQRSTSDVAPLPEPFSSDKGGDGVGGGRDKRPPTAVSVATPGAVGVWKLPKNETCEHCR